MKKLSILYVSFLLMIYPVGLCNSQLAVPVIDPTNIGTGYIIKAIQDGNEFVREVMLPLKDNIAAIADFMKTAKGKVNIVFKNLGLVKGIVEVREKISEEFLATLKIVNDMEELPQSRWKYRWQLAQMWYHSRDVFNIFEVASKDGTQGSIMDDKDRIILLKQTYKELQSIHMAIRLTKRRMLKQEQILKRQAQEISTFINIFSKN